MAGIVTVGYKVIQTVGEDITVIDYHRGWCIEFASTATVVIATLLQLPVSTTHCQIGAVTAVGMAAFGTGSVDFKLLCKIVMSWVLTLPFAAVIAILFLVIVRAGISH